MKTFGTKEDLFSYLENELSRIKLKISRESAEVVSYDVEFCLSVFGRWSKAKKKRVKVCIASYYDRRN